MSCSGGGLLHPSGIATPLTGAPPVQRAVTRCATLRTVQEKYSIPLLELAPIPSLVLEVLSGQLPLGPSCCGEICDLLPAGQEGCLPSSPVVRGTGLPKPTDPLTLNKYNPP
eukprot:1160307-Pelagomonas_calceolata.AAC.7